jgi:type IV secretion system protein VirB11
MSESISLQRYINKYFGKQLADESITEICYNGKGDIWALHDNGEWKSYETELAFKSTKAISKVIASAKQTEITTSKPILSSTLANEERVQVVMPPATKQNYISITIRKPSKKKISIEKYEEQNLFLVGENKNSVSVKEKILNDLYTKGKYKEFIIEAVKQGKNIIVAGATGSGKTTFMKTLIDFIPKSQRIISIEDVEELVFSEHGNYVQLFYPSEAKNTDFLNATTLLKSCLRMKPDRIVLAELRGGETFDFINIINSGHGGSITSCHAGSVEETFSRLELMTLQNESGQKIPYEVIQATLRNTIDVVIHMADTSEGRRITEVYYKDIEQTTEKDLK